jgi:hypothetical protein
MTPRFVTIRKFHELTGYTEDATRSKIARGDWLQDQVWRKAPDGRILMDLEGFEKWVVDGTTAPTGQLRTP